MEVSHLRVLVASTGSVDKERIVAGLNTHSTGFTHPWIFIDIDNNEDPLLIPVMSSFKSLMGLYPFETRPDIFDDQLNIKWLILQSDEDGSERGQMGRGRESFKREFIYNQKKLREIGGYYGIPILNISRLSQEQIGERVLKVMETESYQFIRTFEMRSMTFEKLLGLDIEGMISKQLIEQGVDTLPQSLVEQLTRDGVFGSEVLERANSKSEFKLKLISKWLVGGQIHTSNNLIQVQRENIKVRINKRFALHLSQQGESKLLYSVISPNPYFKDFVFILLKSTIYSHKKQSTGVIENLGKVRAYGSKIFLEFLNRNDLHHAYRCVNQEGIILSEFQKVVPVEIVFKKYFVGTDKHSYYGMGKIPSLVDPVSSQYNNGIYIRFDWRNPNHISVKTQTDLAENPYYFLIENQYTKNIFFDTFLNNTLKCVPYGDKCVYPELLHGLIDIEKARFNLIKLYCTFEYYMREVGLQILDGCFMLNDTADTFWSEINPDCMRIKSNNLQEEYDKDIWRAGGSSSKQDILKKWRILNEILTKYLLNNREFLSKDYPYKSIASNILSSSPNLIPSYQHIYAKLSKPKSHRKEIILTIDLSKSMPSLVVSSKVSETHSSGDINQALERIQCFDDILIVNLDGAFNDKENALKNKQLIKMAGKKHHVMSGGGIHTLDDVDELLNSGVRKIVVATNTTPEFLSQIPKDRLIVELSVNERNQVLIDGRKTNTGVDVLQKMQSLVEIGVREFSVTFVDREGHLKGLPYQQIEELNRSLPPQVQKLIIAGGVSSLEDLRFLWRLDRVVPQVGSAIWKNKIQLGDIFSEMAHFDEKRLIPAVIKSTTNIVKGQLYLNPEALKKTVETRYLHRYSREHQRVMKKGETSGDEQKVLKVSLDCDGDCLLITVDSAKPLCHNGEKSCFHSQNLSISTLSQISQHIKSRMGSNSYSGLMQSNPELALSKIFEEAWEMVYAGKQRQIHECADLLSHLLMYINGKGFQFQEIIEEMNSRANAINKAISHKSSTNPDKIVIGVARYEEGIKVQELLERVGIKITSPQQVSVGHQIIDKQKYSEVFGESEVDLMHVDPLDISWLLTAGVIDMAVCLNTTIANSPDVSVPVVSTKVKDYRICLLKRTQSVIDTDNLCSNQKLWIASKYVRETHSHLTGKLNIPEEQLRIIKVNSHSESYLLNPSHADIQLCDALVHQEHLQSNTQVFQTIVQEGGLSVGLYRGLRR